MINAFLLATVAVVLAEMGDKTQLMTIALAAEEAVKIGGIAKAKQIVPAWMGTTCGMMIADAFGIVVGIVLHKHIPEKFVKWLAASCHVVNFAVNRETASAVVIFGWCWCEKRGALIKNAHGIKDPPC